MLLTVFHTAYASLGYLSLIALGINKKRDHYYNGVPGTSSPNGPAADTPATAVSCRSPSGQGAWAQIHWFIGCATNERWLTKNQNFKHYYYH